LLYQKNALSRRRKSRSVASARGASPCPARIPAHTRATDREGNVDGIPSGGGTSSPRCFLQSVFSTTIYFRCRRVWSAFPPEPGDLLIPLIGGAEKNFNVSKGFHAPDCVRRGVPRAEDRETTGRRGIAAGLRPGRRGTRRTPGGTSTWFVPCGPGESSGARGRSAGGSRCRRPSSPAPKGRTRRSSTV
jgi:hypothetical protein